MTTDNEPGPIEHSTLEALEPRPANHSRLLNLGRRLFVVGGEEPPKVEARVVETGRDSSGQPIYEVELDIQGVRAERASPPPMHGTAMEAKGFPRGGSTRPYVPDHLEVSLLPRDFVATPVPPKEPYQRATNVIAPDQRRIFRDQSYPWTTIGAVTSSRGSGTGVVVGPRHLLTVNHAIAWGAAPPPFVADWVQFVAGSFDGQGIATAFGEHVYYYIQENGDRQIDSTEEQFDYAVVVLDQRIGDLTGWMGLRSYTDVWDSLLVWSHVGYPSDLFGGQRPSWQGPFLLDGRLTQSDDHEAMVHLADVAEGQSGGPMFATWPGDVGPSVVAVQSWESTGQPLNNGASGGRALVRLIQHALHDFP